MLLQGYVKIAKDGRQYHRFWSDMSNEENAARRILSRLILSGSSLPQEVREQLAALIDPINNRFPGITRRIKFRHRKQGGKNSPFNNSLIAMCVYKEVKNGRTVKEGCATADRKIRNGRTLDKEDLGPVQTDTRNNRRAITSTKAA